MSDSVSLQAVQLVRSFFEHVHGNLGILRFSIEELKPDPEDNAESRVWDVTCSFFESLGAQTPTKYFAKVNVDDKSITIKKISSTPAAKEIEGKYTFIQEEEDNATLGAEKK